MPSETYNIASDTQNVDKRPLGPTARAHCLVHNSGDGYDAFSNDDQRKESHSHVEMCVLESYTGSGAGYPHHHPHLEPKYRKPNGPYVGLNSVSFLEGKEQLQTVCNMSKISWR